MFYIYWDKSDKLLANQLKGYEAKQNISKIQLPIGLITADQLQINESFRNFYIQLYTSESQADYNAISDFKSSQSSYYFIRSKEEIRGTYIQGRNSFSHFLNESGMCPGPTTSPNFKRFSLLLSPLLYYILFESHRQGSLHPSFTVAHVIFIAKTVKTWHADIQYMLTPWFCNDHSALYCWKCISSFTTTDSETIAIFPLG